MHAAAGGEREVARRSSTPVNARSGAPDIYRGRARKFIFELFLALCNADTRQAQAFTHALLQSWPHGLLLPECQRDALVRACRRSTRAAPLACCSHCLGEHLLRRRATLTRARTICNALSAQELATRCMLMLNSLVRVQWHDLEPMQEHYCARLPLPALPAARPCAAIYLDTWRWAPVRNSVWVPLFGGGVASQRVSE